MYHIYALLHLITFNSRSSPLLFLSLFNDVSSSVYVTVVQMGF